MTLSFISKAFWAYDYNGAGHAERTSEAEPLYHSYTRAGDTWGINELFEFNSGVYVSDISMGVMEKYAMLIGGGDTDASKNYDAFWIDTKEMYNVLVNQYGFHPENVYLQFWDRPKGDMEGIYVDGPADWEVDANNLPAYGLGINQNLEVLRAKMTEDDFFYLFANSHGSMTLETGGDGTGGFHICNVEDGTTGAGLTYANPKGKANLKREIDKMSYARCLIVISACGSGTAIHGTNAHPEWNLKGDKRIIITSTDKNEDEYTELQSNNEHWAFLYEGCVDNWGSHSYYPGFLRGMGDINSPKSVKYGYDQGYNAATHNRVCTIYCDRGESTPQIFNSEMAENTYW